MSKVYERVDDELTVAYLDLTGSGIETVAHIRQNGRITVMFCAFDGAPRILRLYGRGEVVEPDHAEYASLRARFGEHEGVRAIIRARVMRIADSCGYAVPLMSFVSERDVLTKYCAAKGEAGLQDYRALKNAASLDGLPGLESARDAAGADE